MPSLNLVIKPTFFKISEHLLMVWCLSRLRVLLFTSSRTLSSMLSPQTPVLVIQAQKDNPNLGFTAQPCGCRRINSESHDPSLAAASIPALYQPSDPALRKRNLVCTAAVPVHCSQASAHGWRGHALAPLSLMYPKADCFSWIDVTHGISYMLRWLSKTSPWAASSTKLFPKKRNQDWACATD